VPLLVKVFCEMEMESFSEKTANNDLLRRLLASPAIPMFSIVAYLFSGVGNGELMQGISAGTILSSGEAYNKPAFLTWYSYCYMLLAWIPVLFYTNHSNISLSQYLTMVWAGRNGLKRMCIHCLVFLYAMIFLNVLWIVGLNTMSVATSNAVYQLQVPTTVALSTWLLKSRVDLQKFLGILVSVAGVCMIVIPPLLTTAANESQDSQDSQDTPHQSLQNACFGILVTFLSAMISAGYQVMWKLVIYQKGDMTRMQGLMDSLTTLGVMGVLNLTLGWPILVLLHVTGMETFETPESYMWPILVLNALMEFTFDSSQVLAIFLYSPVITAVTAPLKIPISFVWDHLQNGTPLEVGWCGWLGSMLVLAGVVGMEFNFSLVGKTSPAVSPARLARSVSDEYELLFSA
jgi:drug/metabolite transporter (DMT)-like permease